MNASQLKHHLIAAFVIGALGLSAVATPTLPYGYTPLEYVETTTAKQYVKTGYTPKADDKVTCVCWVKKVQNNDNSHHWGTIFGSRVTNDQFAYCFFTHQGDYKGSKSAYGRSFATAGSQELRITDFTYEEKITLVCDGRTATWTTEGGTEKSATFAVEENLVDAGCPLYLFNMNIGNVSGDEVHPATYCEGRIYSFSVESASGETKLNFVPCRNPDGAVGFYDTVGGEFHDNAGLDRLYGSDEVDERVSFIRSAQNASEALQYVKTGYIPKGVDRVECVANVAGTQPKSGSTTHHWATIFGARTSNANASYTFFSHANNAGAQYCRSAGATGNTGVNSTSFPYDQKLSLVCDGGTATWTKAADGTTGSINLNLTPVDSTCSLFLFCLNNGAAGQEAVHTACYCKMDLYSFKVTTPASGDTEAVVQRDYVPGRRKDGTVGLFDRAHDNGFVGNAGTGSFAWSGLAFTEDGTTLIAREGTLSADDLVGYTDVEKPTWKTVTADGVASYPGSLTLAGGLFTLADGTARQVTVADSLVLRRGARLAIDLESGRCDRFAVGDLDLSDLTADAPAYIEVNDVAGVGTLSSGDALPLVTGTGLALTAADAKKFRVSGLGAKVAVRDGSLVLVAPRADDVVWSGEAGDGRWFTDGNWQDGAAPETGAGVFFPTGSGATTFDINGLMVRTVVLGSEAGSYVMNGAELLTVTDSITNGSQVSQTFRMPLALGVTGQSFALDAAGPLALVGGVGSTAAALVKTGEGELLIDDSAVAQAGDLLIEGGTVKFNSTDALTKATPGEIRIASGARLDVNVEQGGVERLARTEASHGKRIYVEGDGPNGAGALFNSVPGTLAGCTFSHVTLTGDTRAGGGALDVRPMAGSACGATDASLSGSYTLTTDCDRFAIRKATLAVDRIVNEGLFVIGDLVKGEVTNGVHFADGAQLWFEGLSGGAIVPFVFDPGANVTALVRTYGSTVVDGPFVVSPGATVRLASVDDQLTLNGAVRIDGALVRDDASAKVIALGGELAGNGSISGGNIRFTGTNSCWRMTANEEGFTEKVDVSGVTDANFLLELGRIDITYTGDTATARVFDIVPAGTLTPHAAALITLTVASAGGQPVRNCWLGVEEGMLRLHVADTGLVRTAVWTGGGRTGDPTDPANWKCANDDGTTMPDAVPVETTSVRLSGETVFACPRGTEFKCKEVVLQDAALGADLDWRGLDSTLIAGTIDLRGHKLRIANLNGTGTITNSTGGAYQRLGTGTFIEGDLDPAELPGGEVIVTVPAGETLKDGGLKLTGMVTLVKDGPGTLEWSSTPLADSASVLVTNGVFRTATSSPTLLGTGGSFKVAGLGQLDINQQARHGACAVAYRSLFLEGAGPDGSGALVNSSKGSYVAGLGRVVLTGDATLGGSVRMDVRSDYAPSSEIFGPAYTLTVKTSPFLVLESGAVINVKSISLAIPGTVAFNYGFSQIDVPGGIWMNGSECSAWGKTKGTAVNLGPNAPFWIGADGGTFYDNSSNPAVPYVIPSAVTVADGGTFTIREGTGTYGCVTNGANCTVRAGASNTSATFNGSVRNDGMFELSQGAFNFAASSVLTGSGTILMTGGTATLAGDVSQFGGEFRVSGGTLSGGFGSFASAAVIDLSQQGTGVDAESRGWTTAPAGSRIKVDFGSRRISRTDKVLSWTTPPTGIRYVDAAGRRYLQVRSDGLYAISGLILILR